MESALRLSKRAAKGSTLIELLVIVGILAAVALPNFLGQFGKARTTEASATIDAIKSGEESTINDVGTYLSIGTITGTAATVTVTSDTLGGTVVTTGGSLSTFSASLGVNLDAAKFLDNAAPTTGAKWAVAIGNTISPN